VPHFLTLELSLRDGFGEVTFTIDGAPRPNQFELLGTQDAHPYRIFWRPPADLASGEELTFIATLDDLRGHRTSAQIKRIHVAPTTLSFGIKGARVPTFALEPNPSVTAAMGQNLTQTVSAIGTAPMEYRWLHNGREIAGASLPILTLRGVADTTAGHYLALVRNQEGTAISRDVVVEIRR
jgi:alpha-amylase